MSKCEQLLLTFSALRENTSIHLQSVMKGLNLSRGSLLLLLWMLSVVTVTLSAASTERAAGRSQRRGGNGGSGGAEKRRKFHRIQHGQCSYTFILPELEGCLGGGSSPPLHTEQQGSSRDATGVVQRDSPPGDGEWSSQKLQRLESTVQNNTQWLQKVRRMLYMFTEGG